MSAPFRNSHVSLALQGQVAKAVQALALSLDDLLDATAKPCTWGQSKSDCLVFGRNLFGELLLASHSVGYQSLHCVLSFMIAFQDDRRKQHSCLATVWLTHVIKDGLGKG